MGTQLVDFVFPPRIWDGVTETEGFLNAPRREIGVVSVDCSPQVAAQVAVDLKGIAKISEVKPGKYKCYCLDSGYVRRIVEQTTKKFDAQETQKLYSRPTAHRRELVDFSPEFRNGIVDFYRFYGRSLVRGSMETIKIFLPDQDEQDTQIIVWVIEAIEKFNEKGAIPFSGYLDNVLKWWPYDLPTNQLGKELSTFQRERAKAIKALQKESSSAGQQFSSEDISNYMGVSAADYSDLEEKHKVWLNTKNATNLTWDDTHEEKMGTNFHDVHKQNNDVELASKLSLALVLAALKTKQYGTAFTVIKQIDANEIDFKSLESVDKKFVVSLAQEMGI